MKVAIIPARAGSKRIPNKNLKEFCGKPIISYSIEAAIGSKLFDKVIVSTDSEKIASFCQSIGAEVPFLRPEELSGDHTPTIPVIAHAIVELEKEHGEIHKVCCLYATAPFVSENYLAEGYKLIEQSNVDYAFAATKYNFPIQRAFFLNDQNNLEMFMPEHINTRSQDLVEAFHDAGQFYWGEADAFKKGKPIFSENSLPIMLPSYLVQDIDTLEDWKRAELLFQSMGCK